MNPYVMAGKMVLGKLQEKKEEKKESSGKPTDTQEPYKALATPVNIGVTKKKGGY